MGEGRPEMIPLANWDGEGQPARSAAELVAGLDATWGVIEGALARWTVADLGQVFEQPATLNEAERAIFGPITRQEAIWHVYGHDRHHGGELALGMGVHQLPTLSGW
jgi:DinB family protein